MEIRLQTIATAVGLLATAGGLAYGIATYFIDREFNTAKCYTEKSLASVGHKVGKLEAERDRIALRGDIRELEREISLREEGRCTGACRTELDRLQDRLKDRQDAKAALDARIVEAERSITALDAAISKCGYIGYTPS